MPEEKPDVKNHWRSLGDFKSNRDQLKSFGQIPKTYWQKYPFLSKLIKHCYIEGKILNKMDNSSHFQLNLAKKITNNKIPTNLDTFFSKNHQRISIFS